MHPKRTTTQSDNTNKETTNKQQSPANTTMDTDDSNYPTYSLTPSKPTGSISNELRINNKHKLTPSPSTLTQKTKNTKLLKTSTEKLKLKT